eukprot:2072126-Rhodomonas_salina.1
MWYVSAKQRIGAAHVLLDSAWGMHRHVEMHVPYSRQRGCVSTTAPDMLCQCRTSHRDCVGAYVIAVPEEVLEGRKCFDAEELVAV